MSVVIAGITCQEVVHDYEEQYDVMQGPTAVKKYLVPNWSDRFTVIHGILGLSSVPLPGGLITLKLPMPFPELAAESTNALASMYARNVVCKGVGPPVQGANNIAFTSALITVNFGPYPWTFQGIDYMQIDPLNPYIWIEQHISFASEWITVPGTQVFFLSSGKPVGQSYGFKSPQASLTLTLKNIPYLPAQQIITAEQAPINSTTYLGVLPGYLQFEGGEDSRTQASDGTQTAELTLSFTARSIAPWDFIYNQANSGGTPPFWDQVSASAGGYVAVMKRSDISTIIPAAYTG
jgi:hypothetical protein